jgi:hypothetical protein
VKYVKQNTTQGEPGWKVGGIPPVLGGWDAGGVARLARFRDDGELQTFPN